MSILRDMAGGILQAGPVESHVPQYRINLLYLVTLLLRTHHFIVRTRCYEIVTSFRFLLIDFG